MPKNGICQTGSVIRERLGGMNLRGLSALAELVERMTPPVLPDGIDGDRAKELLARAQERETGAQERQGLQALDRLREVLPEPPSTPIMPALNDDTIPKRLASEISAAAQAAGYSPQGTRARLFAVRALYRLAPDRSRFSGLVANIPWQEIIDAVLARRRTYGIAAFSAIPIGTSFRPWEKAWCSARSTPSSLAWPRAGARAQ